MTKKKPPPPRVDLNAFSSADEVSRNRLLLQWLEDETSRATLFASINQGSGTLDFPSRSVNPPEIERDVGDAPPPPQTGHKTVRLITSQEKVSNALLNVGGIYSNRVYAQLGGGSFMLALDPSASGAHAVQRAAFRETFPHGRAELRSLAHAGCEAAAITSLRAPVFDLAAFAEQSALRMGILLMGYAMQDYPLLQTSLQQAYRGLVHQVMARHFVVDPTVIPTARAAMARLQQRTAQLIDGYARQDPDVIKGCHDPALPGSITPVLKEMAFWKGKNGQPQLLNVEQRATLVLGALVGTVGNVQAAACLVIKALFASQVPNPVAPGPDLWKLARQLALSEPLDRPTEEEDRWKELLKPVLRANPPIPYLPRWVEASGNEPAHEVLLALGGAAAHAAAGGHVDRADRLVWGLPGNASHWCAGMALAWPLIIEIVRQTMALRGLDQQLDATTGRPKGLTQRWGFICESYPLTHHHEQRWAQTSLNVAMRLRPPVRDSADRVRRVILSGAPRIERALRESRHVHFAWFELIESDSVLVLHTVYDGPFQAYIQHFALKVGDLFDALFECIEDPPPTPVDEFPNEFVAHIQRYDRPPAGRYFFSAYPRSEAAQIMRAETARLNQDRP